MKFCPFLLILASGYVGCKDLSDFERVKKDLPLFKKSVNEIKAKSDTLKSKNSVGITLYSKLFSHSLVDSLDGMNSSQLLIRKGLVENISVQTAGEICFNTHNENGFGHMTRSFLLYHESTVEIGDFVVNGFEIQKQAKLETRWTYYIVKQAPD